jgi:hypothetical protein
MGSLSKNFVANRDWFNIANQDLLEEWQKANLEPELGPVPSGLPSYQSGDIIKLFWGPTSIKVDEHGKFYVIESCRQHSGFIAKTIQSCNRRILHT